jgi:hypothetical protein
MTTFTYPCPDPAALAAKILAAGGPKIDPTQLTGTLPVEHGVHMNYDDENGKITITVLSKPFYVSDGEIKSSLDKFFGTPA